jgi:hypothetical protein
MKTTRIAFVFLGVLAGVTASGLVGFGCGNGTSSGSPSPDDSGGDGTIAEAGEDAAGDSGLAADSTVDALAEANQEASTGADGDGGPQIETGADGGDGATAQDASRDAPLDGGDASLDADAGPADAEAGSVDAEAGSDNSAMLTFPGQVATALCNRFMTCCGATPSTFDLNNCISQYVGFGYAGSSNGELYLANGNVTFNASQAQSCLNQINAIDCAANLRTTAQERSIISACFGALVGTLEAGAPCQAAVECSSGEFCMPTDGGVTGVCAPLRANGQPCGDFVTAITTESVRVAESACSYRGSGTPGLACHFGSYVDAGAWFCTNQLGTDASCGANVDCQSMLCDPGANFSVNQCENAETFIYPFACGTFLTDGGSD